MPGCKHLRRYKTALLLLETKLSRDLVGVNAVHEQTLCAAAKHTTE